MYPFTDTKDIRTAKAYALGLIEGTSETEFSPDAELTREMAAVILCRLEAMLMKEEVPTAEMTSFADDAEISEWAKTAVSFLAEQGIILGIGDNTFAPQQSVTREQALALVVRTMETVLKATPAAA